MFCDCSGWSSIRSQLPADIPLTDANNNVTHELLHPQQRMLVNTEGKCLKLGCWKQPSGIFQGSFDLCCCWYWCLLRFLKFDLWCFVPFHKKREASVKYKHADTHVCTHPTKRCEQKPLRDDDDNIRWKREFVERIMPRKKHSKKRNERANEKLFALVQSTVY